MKASKLIPYEKWLKTIVGVSRTAGWYYRRRGMINTVNLCGRLYVTEEEIERFDERLKAGEFSQNRGRQLKAARLRP